MLLNKKKIYKLILFFTIFIVHQFMFQSFFPNNRELLGHDYEYFLPNFMFGKIWFENNLLAIPWFTPSFCCGIPFYPDPQTMFYSLQQLFYIIFEPVFATKILFFYFSLIAYVGMFLLLKKSFNFTYHLSLLGATIFFFNGFFVYRVIVGHLGYVNFIFVPLYCYLLISSISHLNFNLRRIYLILSAIILSSLFYSGTGSLMFVIIFCIITTLLIYNIKNKNFYLLFIGLSKSLFLTLLLSLSKISASVFFLKNFERTNQPLFFENTYDYIYSTLKSLFFFPDSVHFNETVTNKVLSSIGVHELEFGITIVPFLAILLFFINFKNIINLQHIYKPILLSIFIFIIPLSLNAAYFSINKIWSSIPLIGSTWVQIRWNILYIIPLIIFSLVIFNSTSFIKKNNYLVIILIFVVVFQNIIYDKKYYHNQLYNPQNMTQFSKVINDQDISKYSIKKISTFLNQNNKIIRKQRNDHFKNEGSSYFCYQPIFGYELEKFPKNNLSFDKKINISNDISLLTGDVQVNKSAENFNFLNPTCFLFPDENECKPGDLFTKDQEINLLNFLKYKKIIFKKNMIQNISDYISLITFIILLISLIISSYFLYTKKI